MDEAFRAEDLDPFIERHVGGDQDGAPLVALSENYEELFRPGAEQGARYPSGEAVAGAGSGRPAVNPLNKLQTDFLCDKFLLGRVFERFLTASRVGPAQKRSFVGEKT